MPRYYRICLMVAVVHTLTLQALESASGGARSFTSDIEYGTASGESLKLDASVPEGKGPFPIAILVHGGGWGSGDKSQVHVPPTEPFSSANYTWFSIDYRLAPRHRWPACIDDVRTAIRWVKDHATQYKGDAGRIVLVGYSAGGHLAAFAAATAEDDTRVDAVVLLAGPTDLESDCGRRGEVSPALQALFNRAPELDDEARRILRETSPLNYLTAESPPTLLIHGTVDESVPYSQSVKYQERLSELGVPSTLITIPGGDHRLRNWASRSPGYQAKMMEWLRGTLDGSRN